MIIKENPKLYYSKTNRLGKGSFGSVYVGKMKDPQYKNEKFAIKITNISSKYTIQNVANEIKIMDICASPYVIKHIRTYIQKDSLWTIMEFCDGGNLGDMLTINFDECYIAFITESILNGLSYLHKKNVIHRDLKSDNILIFKDGSIKIGDFGLSTRLNDIQKKKILNSRNKRLDGS